MLEKWLKCFINHKNSNYFLSNYAVVPQICEQVSSFVAFWIISEQQQTVKDIFSFSFSAHSTCRLQWAICNLSYESQWTEFLLQLLMKWKRFLRDFH